MVSIGVQAAGVSASARMEENVTFSQGTVSVQPDTLVNTARYEWLNKSESRSSIHSELSPSNAAVFCYFVTK